MLDLDPETRRDPLDDLRVINQELAAYSPALAERPQIVVANKADLPETLARRDAVGRHCAAPDLPLHALSAGTGAGRAALRPVGAHVAVRGRLLAPRDPGGAGAADGGGRQRPRALPQRA